MRQSAKSSLKGAKWNRAMVDEHTVDALGEFLVQKRKGGLA